MFNNGKGCVSNLIVDYFQKSVESNPMKRFLPVLIPAILLFGCATLSQPDIDRITRGVQEAARIGTAEAVRERPEWRATFTLVRDEVRALAARESLTVNDLLGAIDKLPVAELSSDGARLAISAVRFTVAVAGWSEVDIVQSAQIRPVMTALDVGMTAGLAESVNAGIARGLTPGVKLEKHYKAKKGR